MPLRNGRLSYYGKTGKIWRFARAFWQELVENFFEKGVDNRGGI